MYPSTGGLRQWILSTNWLAALVSKWVEGSGRHCPKKRGRRWIAIKEPPNIGLWPPYICPLLRNTQIWTKAHTCTTQTYQQVSHSLVPLGCMCVSCHSDVSFTRAYKSFFWCAPPEEEDRIVAFRADTAAWPCLYGLTLCSFPLSQPSWAPDYSLSESSIALDYAFPQIKVQFIFCT